MGVTVYDFDNTLYKGDSTLDFYCFCLTNNVALARYWLQQLYATGKYLCGFYVKREWKEEFYSFLLGIDNIEMILNDFWRTHFFKINTWYFEQRKEDDIIISASPEFLLKPLCDRLKLNGDRLIASRVDKKTGRYFGENCYGEEKVRRLREEFPNIEIESFYTDSRSDFPLAELANNVYIVKKGVANLVANKHAK